jgi:dienelactone hydrolase
MKYFLFLLVILVSLSSVNVQAALRTEVIEYKHGDVVLEGYLAYDGAVKGKRPGVIVVHEWWGLNPYARMRTEQLAKLGYIAFAIDMYGKGVRAKDPAEAGSLSGIYRGKPSIDA